MQKWSFDNCKIIDKFWNQFFCQESMKLKIFSLRRLWWTCESCYFFVAKRNRFFLSNVVWIDSLSYDDWARIFRNCRLIVSKHNCISMIVYFKNEYNVTFDDERWASEYNQFIFDQKFRFVSEKWFWKKCSKIDIQQRYEMNRNSIFSIYRIVFS